MNIVRFLFAMIVFSALSIAITTTNASERRLRAKILRCGRRGRVYPETQEVEVYIPGQEMQKLGIDDTLDGGDALSGFTLAVKDIFAA